MANHPPCDVLSTQRKWGQTKVIFYCCGGKQIFNTSELNLQRLMEQLLNSRLSRDQSPTKLENLSPEKFGKSAYANLTFTPSKLVDNVLYKEVTTLKKIEEESSKVRESEAYNSLLKDRLGQVQEERDGIEQTLTQQIQMYKKMLHDTEIKNEQRMNAVQKSFSEEIQKLISAKEEEAKFAQSQKEILEGRIEELEAEVADLKEQLDHGNDNFENLSKQHEKLEIHFNNTTQKLAETEKRLKDETEKAKSEYEDLSRKFYNAEVEHKGQVEKLQLEREKEKENQDRLHRSELEKIENKRLHEAMVKNQELKDLTATFEAGAQRLNETIHAKERAIDHLNKAVSQEKEKIIEITKRTTAEITNLVHEKNRGKDEIAFLQSELAKAREDYKQLESNSNKAITSLEDYASKLKDDLELNQVTYLRDKDKTSYVIDDLHREISQLKVDNDRLSLLAGENNLLCKEIRNLKDLLLESSLQMEQCKEEFLRLGREKDHLAVKVRELGYENETLHRMKFEKEEEARGWRESYYLSRR